MLVDQHRHRIGVAVDGDQIGRAVSIKVATHHGLGCDSLVRNGLAPGLLFCWSPAAFLCRSLVAMKCGATGKRDRQGACDRRERPWGYNPEMTRRRTDWTADRETDRALVTACRKGDEEAWAAVWQRYGPLVKAVARRTGCDSEEARDVVQRVALVALEKLASLRDPKKLAPWLAGIARFQSLEMIRQRRPASLLNEGSAVSHPRYDDDMVRAEDLARLRQAFVQLEARCQRLLHRLMLKDPPDSYKVVARDEDLSATSIGPIRRRCMQRLGKLIEKLSRSNS